MTKFDLQIWELVCYCLICLFGLLGNSIVIYVIRKSGMSPKHRFRHVPFNVYLMNLAIVDLALSVICLPVYVMSTSAFPHPTGVNGDVFCKLVTGNLPQFWLAGVSIYILVIISFERLNAIAKPFQIRVTTSRKTIIHIALAWFFALLRELPVLVGIRYTATNATVGASCYYWPSYEVNAFIFSCLFVSEYLAPAIIFFINFYRIRKRMICLNGTLKFALVNERQRVKIMQSKEKTIRVVLLVLVSFLILWTPNNIMYFLFQFANVSKVTWSSNYYQLGIILGFSSSCLNPFLYAFQSRKFRNQCKAVFLETFSCRREAWQRIHTSTFTSSNETGELIKSLKKI
ncbi:neuropeptide FF receptor 2-like [Xenia sp. Carnegie-2017]|uniref:neuropeptide FF receptor 2-like n=1 Tax=Xenia sp. Carnegie-2017 TaxID=2897299 RepID=UPI001F04DAB4|nr:neuropeptide FF receptor 2-like [Xenia sp. Carnegie-2017]